MVTTFAPDKAFLGIAPETTPGTPVAPTYTIPYEKCDFEDKPKWLDDPSLRGSMAELYDRIQGVLVSDFTVDGLFFADTFGHYLANILGDRTTTGSADPFTHAFALLNSGNAQPKTHTLTYSSGIPASTGARVYASAAMSELSIKWDAAAQLVKYTTKGMAWGSSIAGAAPTASPSSVEAMASWRAIVGLGGPASGGTLISTPQTMEIDFKRKLEAHYTMAGGQQPGVIQRGSLGVSGKMTVIAADESPQVTLLAATKQALQIVLNNGISTSSAGCQQLQIDLAKAMFKTTKLDQGKTASLYQIDFDGLANSTNAGASGGQGAAKVTLINGLAGTVY